ncbi:NUDIX domain-containing protein [Geodermatophilus sp. URMC 61]|uniref:NUDIX domain-containing protein n=1 Tax=Geodermatophilus sp. URMC 61 TaxID=3423411 RepID=UPI00406C493B
MRRGPWRTLSSRYTHENRWFRVRTDDVLNPDARPGEYNVIEVPAAVSVVALDDRERFCLIREYRYAQESWLWETPVGRLDADDPDPLVAAQRELREETGLASDDWTYLGLTRGLKGLSNQVLHHYLARAVRAGHTAREGVEAIDQQRFVSFQDFFEELRTGQVTDGETVAAVALAAAHLGLMSPSTTD